LLLQAGVEPALLQRLRSIVPPAERRRVSASLVHASELIQPKEYREAQFILQQLIAADPDNASLHFAMGYVHQQQTTGRCL